MKIMQWLIAAVSFMLIFANARMFGFCANNGEMIQDHLERMEQECAGQSDYFKKAEVTRHFLAILQEQHKARLDQTQNCMARSRRFAVKRYEARIKPYLSTLDKMQTLVQKYVDYLKQREPKPLAQQLVQPESQEPQVIEPIIEKIVEVPVRIEVPVEVPVKVADPLVQESSQKQHDAMEASLNELSEKINDLYAQRAQDVYMQELADSMQQAKNTEQFIQEREPISSDRIALQLYQQPAMQSYPQPNIYYPPQQQFIAPSMGMPMYTNYQQQMAMQLQSQAMAMQQQASMLMMHAQQPQTMVMQQPQMQPVMIAQQPYSQNYAQQSVFNKKEQKIDQLMIGLQKLNKIGEHAIQQVLWLIDLEFDIIEPLLRGEVGYVVERSVQERNAALRNSIPSVVEVYTTLIEFATTINSQTDEHMYDYVVRRGRRKQSPYRGSDKKQFLMAMLKSLQHYYAMIQSMQQAFNTCKR